MTINFLCASTVWFTYSLQFIPFYAYEEKWCTIIKCCILHRVLFLILDIECCFLSFNDERVKLQRLNWYNMEFQTIYIISCFHVRYVVFLHLFTRARAQTHCHLSVWLKISVNKWKIVQCMSTFGFLKTSKLLGFFVLCRFSNITSWRNSSCYLLGLSYSSNIFSTSCRTW